MAIIRHIDKNDNAVNYVGTVGFFCVISCTIIMLRFRGFKASLNLSSGKSKGLEHFDKSPGVSLNGAYRTNKDELFGSVHYSEPPKRITPSMVKLPTNQARSSKVQTKNTTEASKPSNAPVHAKKKAPDVTQATQPPKSDSKTEKKLEKQRLAEQKKHDKLAEKERQREEKLRKEREKQLQESQVAQNKNNSRKFKKRTAPQPQQKRQIVQNNNPSDAQLQEPQYARNSLESSISKSSGPPPYTAIKGTPNLNDNSGNTSFAKPVNNMDSWDLISQHRQQMSKQAGPTKHISKQTRLDLHYTVDSTRGKEKGEEVAATAK